MEAIVETTNGKLAGAADGDVLAFKGIPYAQPPVGDLRFRAPRPAVRWDGVRAATAFSATAPQIRAPGGILPRQDELQSEDCLYLNVWTPGLDDERRPVMVWIHGGAFTGGSGSSAWYRGAALAARGIVVVVTINYRLGALGFLYEPFFADEPDHAASNFGMLDQVAALDWVRSEIAHFGGDPDDVTIFGESAGGMSVGALMGSPLAAGRFAKAIPQSGAGHNAFTTHEAMATAMAFAEALGTEHLDPAALRALPVERVLEAQQQTQLAMAQRIRGLGMPFQPVVDGHFLETRPIDAIRAGSAAGVATLIGTCADEWKLFTAMAPAGGKLNEETAARQIGRLIGEGGDHNAEAGQRILTTYRDARAARGESVDVHELFEAALTDHGFRVPADRLAEAQAAHQPQTFAYRFDWPSPAMDGRLGACHAIEIPFVFGTIDTSKPFSGSGPDADALSARVQDAWLSFAHTGDPGTAALPWQSFQPANRPTMILDRECRMEDAPREPERRAWDGIV
ncbi:MAG: carboxylesterase/lipase family protein [Chloroflexi bacterium]|nr:carboxylesterase/lipase family protein [Chloroflexota bacterium]